MQLRPVTLPRFVVIGLRVTVGLLFILMGLWKTGGNVYRMGGRVGEMFTFMATIQPWWALVGWTQIVAGLLLITQRFATVAALVLLGVTVNIAAINVALRPEFGATVYLTTYAFVGLVLLLLHDLDKWQYVFWKHPPVVDGAAPSRSEPKDDIRRAV